MRKKVIFRGRVLPLALLAPQLAITVVFFFWPAGRAIYQSLLREDAFGLSQRVRRARELPGGADGPELAQRRDEQPCLLGLRGGAGARALALPRGAGGQVAARRHGLPQPADLALRRRPGGRGRALALPVPAAGGADRALAERGGRRLGLPAERHPRDDPHHRGRGLEADRLQLHLLPRGPAVHPRERAGGGGDRRCAAGAALLVHHLPAALADDLLPPRRQPHLRLLRDLRRSSTRSPAAGRARRRRRSSTRSTWTGCRTSTSASPRRRASS